MDQGLLISGPRGRRRIHEPWGIKMSSFSAWAAHAAGGQFEAYEYYAVLLLTEN